MASGWIFRSSRNVGSKQLTLSLWPTIVILSARASLSEFSSKSHRAALHDDFLTASWDSNCC